MRLIPMKIAVFEYKPRDKRFFNKECKGDDVTYEAEPLTESNASKYKDVEVACTFISSKVTKKVLEAMPKLKLVVTRSTGYDHIALKEAKKRGVTVCNIPRYGSNTVAEHTFALILNLSRNVHKSYVRAQAENYQVEDLTGFDLKDKWLGVIGVGRIGQHVIKIAKGFGMHVVAYDQYRDEFLADLLHFTYADTVEDVVKKADIITLHVPSTPATKHLVDKELLSKAKKGALLINTSRGDVVDTDALYESLKNGRLGGAGLDVVEGEQLVKEDRALMQAHDSEKVRRLLENKEILKMDNVVFTPHNAFNSKEALHRILDITRENVEAYRRGEPQNVVN
ncbi:hydroxyacid dehydrogenase [Candidatus Woesearchaeota archaeon]|nr:hydroxyacid dehydrogenase [Candidatus Woesearchaeota archaeon]